MLKISVVKTAYKNSSLPELQAQIRANTIAVIGMALTEFSLVAVVIVEFTSLEFELGYNSCVISGVLAIPILITINNAPTNCNLVNCLLNTN